MKQMLKRGGIGAVAIAVLFGSCVSKRKYSEAQALIERYKTDSAQWAQRSSSMQQNVTTLEQRNRTLQQQWDSTQRWVKSQQERWTGMESFYTQQRSSSEKLKTQMSQAFSGGEMLNSENVTSHNGKVYIALNEEGMFSGSNLTSSGKQAIAKIASSLEGNDDVFVTVASGDSNAAQWNEGSGSKAMNNMNSGSPRKTATADKDVPASSEDKMNESSDSNASNRTSDKDAGNKNANAQTKTRANIGDSAYLGSGGSKGTNNKTDVSRNANNSANPTGTARNNNRANIGDSAYLGSGTQSRSQSTSNSSRSGTAGKNTAAVKGNYKNKNAKSNSGGSDVTFKAKKSASATTSGSKSTASNWNNTFARATAIARELSQNGVQNVSVSVPGNNQSASANNGNSNKFQLIVSSGNEGYQMKGNGSTQGNTGLR